MENIVINVCPSQKGPVTIGGCLATLVAASAWRAVVASSECAVTIYRTRCNSLDGSQGGLVTEVGSFPQYDGASFGYGEVGDWICFHIACWCAIAWRWATAYICHGITYLCFVPRWIPVIRMGTRYQHKNVSIAKILFENQPNPWKNNANYWNSGKWLALEFF